MWSLLRHLHDVRLRVLFCNAIPIISMDSNMIIIMANNVTAFLNTEIPQAYPMPGHKMRAGKHGCCAAARASAPAHAQVVWRTGPFCTEARLPGPVSAPGASLPLVRRWLWTRHWCAAGSGLFPLHRFMLFKLRGCFFHRCHPVDGIH